MGPLLQVTNKHQASSIVSIGQPITAGTAFDPMSQPPSLCPVRQQRRHMAVQRDNAILQTRLSDIELSIKNLTAKFDSVLANKLPATNPQPNGQEDLELRVSRLEMLLLRMPYKGRLSDGF